MCVSIAHAPSEEKITYNLARAVATYYASARWEGSRVGEGQLYYAPDGKPEVYFFMVFKERVPEKTNQELFEQVSAIRAKRINQEESYKKMSPNKAENQKVVIRELSGQMSGGDKYGTVVVDRETH